MRRRLFLITPLLLLALLFFVAAHQGRGLLTAGTGWVAKRVCSGVFVASRSQDSLAGAHLPLPVPLAIPATVNRENQSVTARIDNALLPEAPSIARYREGLGCTLDGPGDRTTPLDSVGFVVPPKTGHDARLPNRRPSSPPLVSALDRALDRAFEQTPQAAAEGWGTRAFVVVHKGSIVAERYAVGFSSETPLPGWSMAKSVTSAMIGLLSKAGRIDVMAPIGLTEWSAPDDPRGALTWDQLLRMSSGLAFSENYALPSSDAIQMLFGFQRFAKGRYAATRPLEFDLDTHWNYSSGTSNALQYAMLMQVFDGDLAAYLAFPHEALFGPLGMKSAVLEPDASGTYVGSSFLYATARDWARFGLLYLRHGDWFGDQILSPEWIDYTATPTPTEPGGTYGAHWWLNADAETHERRMPSLPSNLLIASGFEGQSVTIAPDAQLVVVRLGLDRVTRLDMEPILAEILMAIGAETP